MKNFRWLIASFLPALFLLTLLAGYSSAALLDVGPTVPEVMPSTPPRHGYPLWYRDQNRMPLELCLSSAPSPNVAGTTMCNLLPGPTFNPAQPMVFPTNFPDEVFWWVADSQIRPPAPGAVRGLLVLALEGAWNAGEIVSGQQITFLRMRIMVDTPVAGTYRIVFPFGERTFTNVPAGIHAIFHTEDIGIEVGNFQGALQGGSGPFLRWDSGIPIVVNGESFIGDPNLPHTVTGSPLGTNFFRIEGPPGSDLDGLGNSVVQTDLFSVTGKLHQQVIPTPLEVDKAVYARGAAGAQVSVFVTSQPVANPSNPFAPFPNNYALLGTPTVLQVAGTTMTTNQPPDGKYFAATGFFAAPGILPATLTVTNAADIPATVKTVPLVDEVVVQSCSYNPITRILSVQAASLDAVGQPALQLFMPGLATPLGTLNAGALQVAFPFSDNGPPAQTFEIPPPSVTVRSASGGSATVPVSIYVPHVFAITATAAPNGTISPVGVTQVPLGASQSYTITPNAGYTVQSLVVDGQVLPGATSYSFANVLAPHYINAYFAPLSFTVSASAGLNGSVTPTGAVAADFGTSPSFTFTPDPGFIVAELVVDGQVLPAASSYTFSNIAADHSISASFAPGSFTITAAAGANGSITPAGASTVAGASSQSYTITPNAGYRVAALVVDGVTLAGATSYSFANVSANHFINAYFTPDLSFTIKAAAGPNGSITPAGATVAAGGSTQSYSITPNQGYAVSALVVDGTVLPGATSYSFANLSANHYINAYFAPAGPGFTIRAAAGANGSISPAGASFVLSGTDQSYSITPNQGYVVSALVVDGAVLPGATSFTFPAVAGDHYINAYFSPAGPGFTIRAAAGANGSITPAGASFVLSGTDQGYTITPNAGYQVSALVVDGAVLPGATSYTFPAVAGAHYINAYFSPVPAGP